MKIDIMEGWGELVHVPPAVFSGFSRPSDSDLSTPCVALPHTARRNNATSPTSLYP